MVDAPLLLLTRPPERAQEVAQALGARGVAAQVVISPALEIVFETPDLPAARGLVLSSAHAAQAWRRLGGAALPVFAVGDATARAARGIGPVWSAGGDAAALVAGLIARKPATPLLHLRGAHSRGDVAARLTQAGLPCLEAVAYRQEALAPSPEALGLLQGRRPVVLPLYSPRTAKIVSAWPIKAPLLVAAMSEAVSNACESAHIRQLKVAARADSASMLDVIAHLLSECAALEA